MSSMIFVNLPVQDLERSKAFYTSLGFGVNPQFTDQNAACIVISEHIYVMLLVQPFFATFIDKPIANARETVQVLLALSRESRAAVDDIMSLALANGGTASGPEMDHGFMYSRSFRDPDGHIWEPMWMDPAHVEPT